MLFLFWERLDLAGSVFEDIVKKRDERPSGHAIGPRKERLLFLQKDENEILEMFPFIVIAMRWL